jgi:hypothetical protein
MCHTILLLIAIAYLGCEVESLQAFDCNGNGTHYVALDLVEPASCPDPEKDYEEGVPIKIQLLQTDTSLPIQAYQCDIVVSKQVTHCGFDSITYGVHWPAWEKSVETTVEDCRRLIKSKRLNYEGRTIDIELGRQEKHHFYSHGGLDRHGYCQRDDFVSEGMVFKQAYQLVILKVMVRNVRGVLDVSRGTVRFEGGLTAVYRDQVLRDAFVGTIVWDMIDHNCTETVSEIYYGPAVLREKRAEPPSLMEAIVMVEDNTTNRYAGLILKEAVRICELNCFGTQVTGLVVCLQRDLKGLLPKFSFRPAFNPQRIDTQTQLGYLHLNSHLHLHQKFEEVQADICQLDRRSMYQKLQAIAGADNRYALLDLFGPGHIILTSGATAYVTRCIPLEVTRSDYANCTEEIPVLAGGKLMFVDPLSWVLKDIPTVIPCSDVMPVRWKIHGEWYCATPKARSCPAPQKLNVTLGLHRDPFNFLSGLGGGIYTEEQLTQHQQYVLTTTSRTAVVAKVTYAATSYGYNQGHLGLTIAPDDVKLLSVEIAGFIMPFFYWMGDAWTFLMGFALVFVLCKTVLGVAIRLFVLYRRKGCGFWLLAALWDTLFILINIPVQIIKRTASFAFGHNDFELADRSITAEPSGPAPTAGSTPGSFPPLYPGNSLFKWRNPINTGLTKDKEDNDQKTQEEH